MTRVRPIRTKAARRQRSRRGLISGGAVVAGLLLLSSLYLWLIGADTARVARATVIGGPFHLLTGDGRAVSDQSFRGKFLLIYFGYTACRDVCPTTLSSLAVALQSLGARADQVQPLFITVDPGHDSPGVVQAYVQAFSPRLIGLTGSAAAIQEVEAAYRVSSVARHAGGGGGDDVIDHSSVLYLVGPDGRFLAPIRADASDETIARTLSSYLAAG